MIAIYIIGGLIAGFILAYLITSKKSQADSGFGHRMDLLEQRLADNQESAARLLSEMKSDMSERLESSQDRIDRSTRDMHERVAGFTESITKMDESLRTVHQSVATSTEKMSSFQDIFKTPKLRGQWGESNLRFLLEQTYDASRIKEQHYFGDGKDAVDFALVLPNDYLLPIDSKFPMEVFTAYAEEADLAEKTRRKATFIASIKKEIDGISSKYIKPEERTTDMALMYIPAEAVYYELMFGLKDTGIDDYAKKKRVQLVSPNTLQLSLNVIEHWYRDIKVAEQTKSIIEKLGRVVKDAGVLEESYAKLGKHLSNAQGAYEDTGKRVELMTGRVKKVIAIGETKTADEDLLQ